MDTLFSVYRYALDSATQRGQALSDLGHVTRLEPDHITDTVRFTTHSEGMIDASRTVERLLMELSPAKCQVWAGFQKLSHLREARPRYEAFVQQGARVVIAGAPDEPVRLPGAAIVALPAGHPLLSEWFVMALSERYSALLVAVDLDARGDDTQGKTGRFEGLLTYDGRVIADTQRALERALLRPHEAAPTRQITKIKLPRRAF
jgi:DICT domain-containing protein